MNNRIETYCSVDFLENFFNSIPNDSLVEILLGEHSESVTTYSKILDLFFKKANLLIDDYEKISELALSNPWFHKLIDSNNGSGNKIIDYSKYFKYLLIDNDTANNSNPNSLHLYDGGYTSLSKGQFKVSFPHHFEKLSALSIYNSYNVQVGEIYSLSNIWSILRGMNLPINAAIISDNYVFNNLNSFQNNLFRIIENILPPSLEEMKFHLSFFTVRDFINNDIISRISNFIITLNLDYEVDLSIFGSSRNQLHDRLILTNYYILKSGHSFEYYDNNDVCNKDTILDIAPLNTPGGNLYFEKLSRYKRIASRANEGIDLYGSGVNRLLN